MLDNYATYVGRTSQTGCGPGSGRHPVGRHATGVRPDPHRRGTGLSHGGRALVRAVVAGHGHAAILSPRVTISVTPTFAPTWLISLLAEFSAAHPTIDLRITATARIARNLVAGEDLPQSLVALSRLTLLHDTRDLWPQFITATQGPAAPLPSRGLRFNQMTLALDAALAGQGIALARRHLVQRDLTAGRLIQPIGGAFEGGLVFHLLTPRQGSSRACLQVRDWMLGMTDA